MKIALGLPLSGGSRSKTFLGGASVLNKLFCATWPEDFFLRKRLGLESNPKLQRDDQLGCWAKFQPRRQALPLSARSRLESDSWPMVPRPGGMQEARSQTMARSRWRSRESASPAPSSPGSPERTIAGQSRKGERKL